jgi:16S rRNA C967 or C1407 C5-methylase (RsmB/RsmF family)
VVCAHVHAHMVRGGLVGTNTTTVFHRFHVDQYCGLWNSILRSPTSRASSAGLTTMAAKQSKHGKPDAVGSEFDSYFSQLWGSRWSGLSAALCKPTSHCVLLNAFVDDCESCVTDLLGKEASPAPWSQFVAPLKALEWSSVASTSVYPPPLRDVRTGLMPWYWLDPASLCPPLALLHGQFPGSCRVLDMCAAPGGKSLALAQLLFVYHKERSENTSGNFLISNEIDGKRRSRLLTVLRQYIPQSFLSHNIRVTGRDGISFAKRSSDLSSDFDTFDLVLIDAPCSSDRHVAQHAVGKGGAVRSTDWTLQRCKSIAKDQQKLVTAGIKALNIGGCLVYSTCSITDIQNDRVVEKVLDRAGPAVSVVSHGLSDDLDAYWVALGAERTKHGWIILPDSTGWGPIYWCTLRKDAQTDMKRVKANKYPVTGGKGGELNDDDVDEDQA